MDHEEQDAEWQHLKRQAAEAQHRFEQAREDLCQALTNDRLRQQAGDRLQAAADQRDQADHALNMYEIRRNQAGRDTATPPPTDAPAEAGITQRRNDSPEQDADLERKERFYRSRPEGRG
jgi:hypothetical protein